MVPGRLGNAENALVKERRKTVERRESCDAVKMAWNKGKLVLKTESGNVKIIEDDIGL